MREYIIKELEWVVLYTIDNSVRIKHKLWGRDIFIFPNDMLLMASMEDLLDLVNEAHDFVNVYTNGSVIDFNKFIDNLVYGYAIGYYLKYHLEELTYYKYNYFRGNLENIVEDNLYLYSYDDYCNEYKLYDEFEFAEYEYDNASEVDTTEDIIEEYKNVLLQDQNEMRERYINYREKLKEFPYH